MKDIDRLKKQHEETDIPDELERVVKQAIQQGKASRKKRRVLRNWALSTAAAAALFVGGINVSPTIAQAAAGIPVLGSIVKVLTVQTLKVDEEKFQANLETPAIEGLENEQLQHMLNEKYIEENKALYLQFEKDMAELKQQGGGNISTDSGYEVLTDTEQLLSIVRYETQTAASSSTILKHDTIDKQRNVLITLPSLFTDDRYIDAITAYINEEMQRQMAQDENISYFLLGGEDAALNAIEAEQDFYITADHKLVISFNDYEAAPGYMGAPEFEIPSDVIKDFLVSDVYIR